MSLQYYYNYAEIDLDSRMCIGVHSMTAETICEEYIPIPTYDEEYCFKYYINGSWYEDAEGTIPWESSLI